ncbi:hypothetical protein SAMN05443575_0327 [Jatrophihabitans endophyticus]|uniref:ATP-grasp domain-containing protein n=1 Tax=Jatrophihabitans endophyticus TaxID=1206085 RepID=A0A1M5CRF8_9ACTN|nr:hypothetical protein [Jatrophihabitans endophyticus]SHF57303.1 hypothetical protein SAMN05443575_0327 [Jatrophihabitans endophyticus]
MTAEVGDRLAALVRDRWSAAPVVLAVNRFDGAMRALAAELAAVGADVRGIVSAEPIPVDVHPAAPRWAASGHGHRLTRTGFDRWLRTAPDDVATFLDVVDPHRQARVLASTYTAVPELFGRPVHGWWRADSARWEDKTAVDTLWAAAGMPAPAHRIVDLSDPPDAAGILAGLDRGRGVMIAADASQVVLGSSKGLRWVHSPDETRAALADLARFSATARAATFVDGVPFSILGMVRPDGVAVFEPFEILTLLGPEPAPLVYCGTSTHWHAPAPVRDGIRRATRRVGTLLAEQDGYRGVFSVDGVAGRDFVATELNPRHVSGLTLWAGRPDVPFRLFARDTQEGTDAPYASIGTSELEEFVASTLRDSPGTVAWIPDPDHGAPDRPSRGELVCDGVTVQWRRERDGIRIVRIAGAPRGAAVAPYVAAAATDAGVTGLRAAE